MSEEIVKRFAMEGVEVWKNPKNKFCIFQLHYTADERKKDPKYRENVKSGMPIRQYMQEYELQWDSYAGAPVYSDFQKSIHGSITGLSPEIGLPLMRGWDFGLTPACVIAQYVEGQLRILREFTEINMGADRFSEIIMQKCAQFYPRWGDRKRDWIDCVDPSGFFQKDTDQGSCCKILGALGLTLYPGPVAYPPRRAAVEYFLTQHPKSGPSFLIDLAKCPVLVRGFEGGYRYPEDALDIEPNKARPIKDEHSHPHDALQYIACKAKNPRTAHRATSPKPSYSTDPNRHRIVKEGSAYE